MTYDKLGMTIVDHLQKYNRYLFNVADAQARAVDRAVYENEIASVNMCISAVIALDSVAIDLGKILRGNPDE